LGRLTAGVLLAGALVVATIIIYRGSRNPAGLNVPPPRNVEDGRSLGSSGAPVKLDVWSDFQCAACRIFAVRIKPALVKTYIETGKARLAFHDMSFLGSESLGAAMSARCADRQGKFWPYHDLLLANQRAANKGEYTRDRSKEFAAALGLNLDAFSACLDDPATQGAVEAETRQAYVKGIKETPTLLVDGVAVTEVNNWQVVSAAIEAALKGATGSAR
jgi:protein-disulfide isomerase